MEHSFLPTATTRAEALRWLTISEKLLSARDLMGSKSFATRARDSDPTLSSADQILAVADTLLAGDRRICDNQQDWYAILRLTAAQGRDNTELIATQYRSLALVLNPQQNKFPFSDQAFRLVVEAWSVLSSPLRKSMYDKELAYYQQQQQQQSDLFGGNPNSSNFNFSNGGTQPLMHGGGVPSQFAQVQPQNFMSFTSGSNIAFGSGFMSNPSHEHVNSTVASSYKSNKDQVENKRQKQRRDSTANASGNGTSHEANANVNENVEERGGEEEDLARMDEQDEEVRVDEPTINGGESAFWTACPYCYYMYEYPTMYADCSIRCQNCKRAFQAVVIPSPPPIVGDHEYFCCWGFLPVGFSMENWEKQKGAASAWTPFSPMFTCPQMVNNTTTTRTTTEPVNNNDVNKKRGGRKSSAPRVYIDDDDDEVYVEISDSGDSDDDWRADNSGDSEDDWGADHGKKRKTPNPVKGKGASGSQRKSARISQVEKGKNVNLQDGLVSADGVEMPHKTTGEPSKKGTPTSARRQPSRIAKNHGKLDLNVECSNEAEESAPRMNEGNGPGRGEDDNNIEGNGFFEGLDELFSNLPILNVSDDKAVRAT